MYQVLFTDKALKSLKRIPNSDAGRIISAVESLAQNPEEKTNVKRLNKHPLAVFRLRVGNYRILFDKADSLRILSIIDVGHRKNIYE